MCHKTHHVQFVHTVDLVMLKHCAKLNSLLVQSFDVSCVCACGRNIDNCDTSANRDLT